MAKKQTSKNLNELFDEEFISRILTGEKKLFEALMRKYNDRLFRIGMAIINNNIEVGDVMQTVYINAYENLSKFKKRSSFGTWIIRIMINESLLQLKRKQRYVSMEVGKLEAINVSHKSFETQTPSNFVIDKELAKALENTLALLPEKYRLVFVMRIIENMTTDETAEVLGITEANVKIRLNRARAMLRQRLNVYYDNIYELPLPHCDAIVKNVFSHLGI